MSSNILSGLRLLVVIAFCRPLVAQDFPPVSVQNMAQRVVDNEAQLHRDFAGYGYRLKLRLLELNGQNAVVGQFRSDTRVTAGGQRQRTDEALEADRSTLRAISLTVEDIADLRNLPATIMATLTQETISNHDLTYVGTDEVGGVPSYVLEIRPPGIQSPGRRLVQGRIWVDDQEMNVVRSVLRTFPAGVRKSPEFFPELEVVRKRVDGHWFPASIRADGVLSLSTGSVRILLNITIEDYAQQ